MSRVVQQSSRTLFLSLIALVLFSPVGIDIYLPSVPTLIDHFAAEQHQVQNTVTVFLLTMGLGQLVIGPLADHWGRRRIALSGIVLYGISSLIAVFVNSITELMWVRAIQGFAACCASVTGFAVVRDCFSGQQSASVYSYMLGAINLAPALAPVIGGVLINYWGWQACFYALAIYSVWAVVQIYCCLPETKPDFSEPIDKVLKNYCRIMRHKSFQYYSLCCLAAMAMILAYVTWSPILLIKQAGLSQLAYGALFGLNALWIMGTSIFAPRLMRRLGQHFCTLLGLMLMVVAGLLMLISYSLSWPITISLMMPVGVASVGFALILGSATSLALNPFPDCAGTAAASLGCIQMVGAAIIVMGLTALMIPPLILLSLLMLLVGGIPLLLHYFSRTSAGRVAVSSLS